MFFCYRSCLLPLREILEILESFFSAFFFRRVGENPGNLKEFGFAPAINSPRPLGEGLGGEATSGSEEALGVGGEGDVLGEPEDGEHHALDAAGVGGDVVETVVDDDGAAGGVDEEVLGHRHALHIAELVEEAFLNLLVDLKVLDGMSDGLAEEVGVGDEVGEVDGIAGFKVDSQEVGRVHAMCSSERKAFGLDDKGCERAVLTAGAPDVEIAVTRFLVEALHGLQIVDVFHNPALDGGLHIDFVAVTKAKEHQLPLGCRTYHAFVGPLQGVGYFHTDSI